MERVSIVTLGSISDINLSRDLQDEDPTEKEIMKSIFSEGEATTFLNLTDEENRSSGRIRGPFKEWNISGKVNCGQYTSINGPFDARRRVTIGRYCAFGRYIALLSNNHRTDMPNQQVWLNQRFGFKLPNISRGPIEVGHNVWIGDKANILSGVQVGHGCVIGAGATLTKSIGPFEIAVGSPAHVIRKRFTDNVISQLLEIKWWNWSDERIAINKRFFETEIPSNRDVDIVSLCV